MTARDHNLDLSPEATDLPLIVTNVLGQELDLEATPLEGLAVRVNLTYTPGNTAKSPTLNIIVHGASSSGVASSDPVIGSMEAPRTFTEHEHVELIIPFTLPNAYRFVRLEYAISSAASDSPSWSQVEAFAIENVGLTWSRAVSFH